MIEIRSPLVGWVTLLGEVPDPVFADRMLGDGVAVDPVEGRVVAPGPGVVSSIHASGHAVTLALDSGPVLLIHIGLDTVALGGEGFSPAVSNGDRVRQGQTLIDFDLDLLARRARSLVTPVIVTNGERFPMGSSAASGPISIGDPLFSVNMTGVTQDSALVDRATASRSLHLPLAHGLHARPAARIAKLASEFEAEVEFVTEDGRTALARSPVTVLGLGLSHGAEVVVRASGPQAEAAVKAVVDLLETGMGEMRPLADAQPTPASEEVPSELRGICAVPGLVIGPAWRLRQSEAVVAEEGQGCEQEQASLAKARARLESALALEAEGDSGSAGIAAAHLAMVDDPVLNASAQRLIASGKSAAFAWREAIRELAAPLRRSSDPRFAERVDDLADLERRLLAELGGEAAHVSAPDGAIVIAETLYPSQLTTLAGSGIAGIATAAGGATSHAAIIAAGLGLPMLVGLGPSLDLVEDGTPLILRDDVLCIAPDDATLEKAREDANRRAERRRSAATLSADPARTKDGARIEVFANLGSVAESRVAVEQGAEGCGLLRTEFLFLDRDAPPDEAEQRHAYQQIADALQERPLIIRTLDIGADKPAPWLQLSPEDNPALGLRGIRLQLAHRELFETQLRALLGVRASGTLKVMLPMIAAFGELRDAKNLLDSLATEMKVPAPELGIMVETPAAALMAGTLAREAAFFSIGTNDLSQYALARDRTNPVVARGLDALDPAVLRLIDETARGGALHGRVTGVCGGLAAMPEAVPILIGLGITELSVPAGAIAEIKALVRSLHLERCRSLAAGILAAPDAQAVRWAAGSFLEQVG